MFSCFRYAVVGVNNLEYHVRETLLGQVARFTKDQIVTGKLDLIFTDPTGTMETLSRRSAYVHVSSYFIGMDLFSFLPATTLAVAELSGAAAYANQIKTLPPWSGVRSFQVSTVGVVLIVRSISLWVSFLVVHSRRRRSREVVLYQRTVECCHWSYHQNCVQRRLLSSAFHREVQQVG